MLDGYASGFRQHPAWLVLVATILFGQAGLALQLFGTVGPWSACLDSRPIMNGRHPLHLYHGVLGVNTFRERAATTCYDPAVQAGYPKTPIFDNGVRPAELFLVWDRSAPPAAAYKLGVFISFLCVPLVFVLAARGFGLSCAGACLAAIGGCLISWSVGVRAILDAGQMDLLLAGMAVMLFLGGLVRYTLDAGLTAWFLLTSATVFGWMIHPVVCLGMLPLFAVFYIIAAPRHGLSWHLGMIAVPLIGIAPNVWWLRDWVKFCWLKQASPEPIPPLPTLAYWLGTPKDYATYFGSDLLSWALLGVAILGLGASLQKGTFRAIVILALAILALLLARLGETWTIARSIGLNQSAQILPALQVLLAAQFFGRLLDTAKAKGIVVFFASLALVACGWGGDMNESLGVNVPPLKLGLSVQQQAIVDAIRTNTTPTARILIEETEARPPGWNWTALLPMLTECNYLGGLDPESGIEHSYCNLRNGKLAGRAFDSWTASELQVYVRRYNVGWVLCRTPAARAMWTAYSDIEEVARFHDHGEVVLYVIHRKHSYVLAGSATIERADASKIVLTDLVPNDAGEVILSYHAQNELQAVPLIVRMSTSPDPHDPIPFIKLIMPGPVSRVTLTWEHP